MSGLSDRPYAITEQDYLALLSVIKTMRLIEYLGDEHNPSLGTVETELVSSALHLLAGQLDQIMSSIDRSVIVKLEKNLDQKQDKKP